MGLPYSKQTYLIIGIIGSLVVSLNGACNWFSHFHVQKVGFSAEQANFDSDLIMGLIYFPVFCSFLFSDSETVSYDWIDFMWINLNKVGYSFTQLAMNYALKYGNAATCDASDEAPLQGWC